MLSLYLSHLTSFLHLWPHILSFLLLLWWINCSYSTFIHFLHFFTDATLSHFIRDTAQLILFSFIIRISLSTALLPSTHIYTVKLLPQKKEANPSFVLLYSSNYGLISPFPIRTKFLENFIHTCPPSTSSLFPWSLDATTSGLWPVILWKLFLSRSQWPPYE